MSSTVASAAAVAAARRVQADWRTRPLRARLQVIRRLRGRLAGRTREVAASVRLPHRSSEAETLTAEVLPLLDACRFLEREAPSVLQPRRPGRRGRPLWLAGTTAEVRREPRGVVLVIGPSNYPLLLPGVQALQALAAGNAVLLKPGAGGLSAARLLAAELAAAGLPDGALQVLGEDVNRGVAAIEAGVDLVVLTGALRTGRAVLGQLANTVTPAIMELSGCDPVLICDDADLELAADALRFGLTLNGGFTCIAPRRVYVHASRAAELERLLAARLDDEPRAVLAPAEAERAARLVGEALGRGARIVAGDAPGISHMRPLVLADVPDGCALIEADLGVPVLSLQQVASDEEAVERAARCPYRLGAAVFGSAERARRLADRIAAGVVVVNDVIVPTADPRLPFGGSGASGFGVTRGVEGLLEMTVTKTVIERRGRFRPHLEPVLKDDERLFAAFAAAAHGATLAARVRALAELMRLAVRRGRQTRTGGEPELRRIA